MIHPVKASRGRVAGALAGLRGAPWWRDAVAPFLAHRALLLFVVAIGAEFIEPRTMWHALPGAGLLDPWLRWDSEHYLMVASVGYGHSAWGTPNAFFPLYPWGIRLLATIMPPGAAALVVANASALGAVVLLRRWVSEVADEATARRAVLWLLAWPTSFFLSAGYAESTFLLLLLGTWLSSSRARWGLAVVLAVLACLARPQGALAVTVPFLAGWIVTHRSLTRLPWVAVGGVLGAGLVLLVYWRSTGDPLAFLHSPTVRSMGGLGGGSTRSPAPFWAVLLDEGLGQNLLRRLLNWGALAVAGLAVVSLLRRREIPEAVLVAVLVGIPLAAHGTVFDAASMARYVLPAFPVMLVLARWPETTALAALRTGLAAVGGVLAALFGGGLWAE